MKNQELMELSAKAANLRNYVWSDIYGCIYHDADNGLTDCPWNPIADDGTAFRLAVKLLLEIDICHTGVAVRTPNGLKVLVSAEEINDGYAATRMAIVRAAAGIGKSINCR